MFTRCALIQMLIIPLINSSPTHVVVHNNNYTFRFRLIVFRNPEVPALAMTLDFNDHHASTNPLISIRVELKPPLHTTAK